MNSQQALKLLEARMKQYRGFGAEDTEGRIAVSMVDRAVRDGKPFPLQGNNPWQLYESVPGWEQTSAELTRLAREWWKAAIEERLGLSVDEGVDESLGAYWRAVEPGYYEDGGYLARDYTRISAAFIAGWKAKDGK